MKLTDYKNIIYLNKELQSIDGKERTDKIRKKYIGQISEVLKFNEKLKKLLSEGKYQQLLEADYYTNTNYTDINEEETRNTGSSILCNDIVLEILKKDSNNIELIVENISNLKNLGLEVYNIIKSNYGYKTISRNIKSFDPEIFKTIAYDFIDNGLADEFLFSYPVEYALQKSRYCNEIAIKIINDKNLGINYIKKHISYLSNLGIDVYNALKDDEDGNTHFILERIGHFNPQVHNLFIKQIIEDGNIKLIKEIDEFIDIDQELLCKIIYASKNVYECKLEKYITNNPSQKFGNNIAKAIFDKGYFYIFRDQIENFYDIDENILFSLIKKLKDCEEIYFNIDKFNIKDINILGEELCKNKKTNQLVIILDKLDLITPEMASLLINNNLGYHIMTNINKINSKEHLSLINKFIKANQPLYLIKYINKFEGINKTEIKKLLEKNGYKKLVEEYKHKFTDLEANNTKENQNIDTESNNIYGFEGLDGYYSEFPKTINIKKNYSKKYEFGNDEQIRQILPNGEILTSFDYNTRKGLSSGTIRIWKEVDGAMTFENKLEIEHGGNQDAKINKQGKLLTRSAYAREYGLNRMHKLYPIKNFPNGSSVWGGEIIASNNGSAIRGAYGIMNDIYDIQAISDNKYLVLTNKRKIRIHSLDSDNIEEVGVANEGCYKMQMIPNGSIFIGNSEDNNLPSEITIFRNNGEKREKEVIGLKNFINRQRYLNLYALPDESILITDSQNQCIKRLSKVDGLRESEVLVNIEGQKSGNYINFEVDPNGRIYLGGGHGPKSIYDGE